MNDGTDGTGVKEYLCQIDGGASSLCTSPYTISGSAGETKILKVQATDYAGNRSQFHTVTLIFQKPLAGFTLSGASRAIIGKCNGPYVLTAIDEDKNPVNLGANRSLSLQSDFSVQLYKDSSCTTTQGPVTLAKSESQLQFYLKGGVDDQGWLFFNDTLLGDSNRRYV